MTDLVDEVQLRTVRFYINNVNLVNYYEFILGRRSKDCFCFYGKKIIQDRIRVLNIGQR
jgi:hypothetical protein